MENVIFFIIGTERKSKIIKKSNTPMNIEARKELTSDILSVFAYCSGRSLAIFEICAPVNRS